jgi:protoporphyrinogen oxidase
VNRVKNLIVGGGFTGLELASRMPGSLIITPEIGGLIGSVKQAGFTFDYGGHVYTTTDPRIDAIMQSSGATKVDDRLAFFVKRWGGDFEWIPYPVQERPDLLGLSIVPEPEVVPANLESFMIKTFGHDFYEKFMHPFNRRVWTTEPRDMDFDWIDGRVELPSERSEKKWGMNSQFYYAPGDEIIATMERRLANTNIEIGNVISANVPAHTLAYASATREHSQEVKYDRLFVTTKMFSDTLGAHGMVSNYVLCVGVGLKRRLEHPFHWIYPDFYSRIHRVTLLSRYHPSMAPKGQDSLLLEIPMGSIETISNVFSFEPDSIADALNNIGLDEIDEKDIATVWWSYGMGYPIQTVGVRNVVADLKLELLEDQVMLCGRWGSHGYFNLQHLLQDVDATMSVLDGDDPDNYLHSRFYYKVHK